MNFDRLPQVISCGDPGSFAQSTLKSRLPEILSRVKVENAYPTAVMDRLDQLALSMRSGRLQAIVDSGAPDERLLDEIYGPYYGRRWDELSFLICEGYFYRSILSAVRYYQPGPGLFHDPFGVQKTLGLTASGQILANLARRVESWTNGTVDRRQCLEEAFMSALWGNRADLSLWPVADGQTSPDEHLAQPDSFLLENRLGDILDYLLEKSEGDGRIHIINDNAGFELVCDLALAMTLLSCGAAGQVVLQVKAQPTFVSDATIRDVVGTIQFLQASLVPQIHQFGIMLSELIASKKLKLVDDYFFNSPVPLWDAPEAWMAEWHDSRLVVTKGDFNYRRITGDLKWEATTPFAQVLGYFPAPLAALRTAKSEVMVGLTSAALVKAASAETNWRTNGRWGVIQFNR